MPSLTKAKIATGIGKITLNEIKLEYNLEKILLDNYEGAEHDLACYLVKKHYDRRIASFETPITDRRLQDRVLTEAKWFALDLLTTNLPALIDRTQLYMLMEADQTGWYRKLEYKDIEELLMSMMDDVSHSSEIYDWKFIVEKLVPAAKAFGIPPELLGNATHQIRKLRQAVPAVRLVLQRLENHDLSEEQAHADLKWIVESVANPTIQSGKLKPELDKYRGIIPDSEVSIKGHIYMTKDGTSIMLIPLKNDLERAVVEQRLRKRVDFIVADYKQFAEQALELLDIKEAELWTKQDKQSKDG